MSEADFDTFWSLYPRRIGKGAAQKAWNRAVDAMKVNPELIVQGAKAYAAAKRGTDIQYVAHPSTWLNQQRWLDDHTTSSVEADATPYKQDEEAVGIVKLNKIVQAERRELVRRTREKHFDVITEAARRLNTSFGELYDCLMAGSSGIDRRAWHAAAQAAVANSEFPAALPISRDHWLEAKERLESRQRSLTARQQ